MTAARRIQGEEDEMGGSGPAKETEGADPTTETLDEPVDPKTPTDPKGTVTDPDRKTWQ
jgi:hypothetical protein